MSRIHLVSKQYLLCFFGGTDFEQPLPNAACRAKDRFLGVRDLYVRFEGVADRRGWHEGWTLALMEMLTDPMLRQWVPS